MLSRQERHVNEQYTKALRHLTESAGSGSYGKGLFSLEDRNALNNHVVGKTKEI